MGQGQARENNECGSHLGAFPASCRNGIAVHSSQLPIVKVSTSAPDSSSHSMSPQRHRHLKVGSCSRTSRSQHLGWCAQLRLSRSFGAERRKPAHRRQGRVQDRQKGQEGHCVRFFLVQPARLHAAAHLYGPSEFLDCRTQPTRPPTMSEPVRACVATTSRPSPTSH